MRMRAHVTSCSLVCVCRVDTGCAHGGSREMHGGELQLWGHSLRCQDKLSKQPGRR